MATAGNIQLDPKHDDYDFPVVASVAQDGHPGHLTAEQNEKVKQLRTSLEGKGYTDRLDSLTLVCFQLGEDAEKAASASVSRLTKMSHSCDSFARASSISPPPRQCKISRRFTWDCRVGQQGTRTEY